MATIKNNNYRFFIEEILVHGGTKRTMVTPINTDNFKITSDKNERHIFLRKKLSGSPVFIGNDYQYFKDKEAINICQKLFFIIEKKCSENWTEIYKGIFSIYNISFDSDRCTCIINNLETQDEYSCILNESKNEYNLLDKNVNPDIYTIQSFLIPFKMETVTVTENKICAGAVINGCFQPTYNMFYPATKAGVQYDSQQYILLKQVYEVIDLSQKLFKLTAIWGRYYQNTLNNVNNNPVPPVTVLPVYNWVNYGSVLISGLNGTHWIAPALNFSWNPSINILNGCNNFEYINTVNLSVYKQTFNKCRNFLKVLKNLVSNLCGYNFVSNLFENTINPVTNETNRLMNIMVASGYDIKYPLAAEPYEILNYTFEDFEDILLNMFNCYWFIDNGNFRIEHISWFTYQQLYGNYYNETMKYNKYKYDFNIPQQEKWTFVYSTLPDFIGVNIMYYNCIDWVNKQIKEYSVNKVCTELVSIVSNDSVPDDCFVLLDTDGTCVIDEVGKLSGNIYPNNALSTANIQDTYFKHNRPLLNGNMNNITQTFITEKRKKFQEKFDLSKCTCELPQWNQRIKTYMGTGYIEGYEYDLKKNILSLEISYDL